ncbi:MAG: FAD binding domain-containing protein [Oscillospiraceae bacterium]|jgi:CO/xanthine dehydrogenase FAD-binding subunit
MIPFDFEYHRPDTVGEAIEAFNRLDSGNKSPVYYGGGTELITMARVGNLSFGSVIDIKSIPDCKRLEYDNDSLILGSALSLSDIVESNCFPLLTRTAGRIADHTSQRSITLGGNLSSTIIYRETVLPLLLTDASITVASPMGLKGCGISELFNGRLNLNRGEFVVSVSINKPYLDAPYFHQKKTKNEKIDYPLLTTAGLKTNGRIRIAFSGLASCPFRNSDVESIINDNAYDFNQRAEKAAEAISSVILDDISGSAEYRKFVLNETLVNILETMKDL